MKSKLSSVLGLSITTLLSGLIQTTHALPLNEAILEKPARQGFFQTEFTYLSKKSNYADLIRTGVAKNTVVQGLALDTNRQQLYTIHSFGHPQTPVINRFSYDSKSNTLKASDAQKPSLYIGHQGITVDSRTGLLLASAGENVPNDGLNIIGFKYNPNSDVQNPIIIKVFNDDYNKNTYTMPSISPDHRFLVVRNIKNGKNVVRGYDLSKISLDHSQDISGQATFEWPIDQSLYRGKYALQALTTDGHYVYLMSGSTNTQNKKIQAYTLQGKLVQNLDSITLGKRESLFTDSGAEGHWEPEGLAIDSNNHQLLVLFAVGSDKNSTGRLYRVPLGN